jgi:hypothetical protein
LTEQILNWGRGGSIPVACGNQSSVFWSGEFRLLYLSSCFLPQVAIVVAPKYVTSLSVFQLWGSGPTAQLLRREFFVPLPALEILVILLLSAALITFAKSLEFIIVELVMKVLRPREALDFEFQPT